MNHNSGQSLFTQAGYTLVVTATDAAGNAATASRRFLVDSTAPALSVRSQAPTGMYVKTPLTLVVDGTDNLRCPASRASPVRSPPRSRSL